MINETIFLAYIFVVSSSELIALRLGKEALISLICVQAVLVNLFVTKEIILFGLTATASDALAVGITLALNLVQEFFGPVQALRAIWISFFSTIFYGIIAVLHLAYLPSSSDVTHVAFELLLVPMPRIIVASLVVYLLVQHIDVRLYAYFFKKFNHRHFVLRNYTSTAITQFLDTLLFSLLGLFGINESFSSLSTIAQIIVFSYIIKLIVIALAAPFLSLSKLIRRQA